MSKTTITDVKSRQILDSRGNPTVEVDVVLSDGTGGRASVASGASTGTHEAFELRDGYPELYDGKGVKSAVERVNDIGHRIRFMDATRQRDIDQLMIDMDATKNKKSLGANAILGVSLAVAKAAAASHKMPLYRYIGKITGNDKYVMPVPMVNIWNGGSHAGWATDLQEYMIMPMGAPTFSEGLRWCAEVFHNLKKILQTEAKYATTVGDEGGYAPMDVKSNEEPLQWIMKAIEKKGYRPGEDILIALDPAASSFYKDGTYFFKYKERISKTGEGISKTSNEMIEFYAGLKKNFPILSIEDGLAEDDWDGWAELTKKLGGNTQIVGDDLYVTNKERLKEGIKRGASNSILIKPNQIGTLTETLDTIRFALENGYTAVVSHRSGETEDTTISHLVVGAGTGQIKTGSVCRGERICKYNELLRIEESLGNRAVYSGKDIFKKYNFWRL